MKEIMGIRVFDMEDLIPMYEFETQDVSANIYCFQNDFKYLMPNVGAVSEFIDIEKSYGILEDVIKDETDDERIEFIEMHYSLCYGISKIESEMTEEEFRNEVDQTIERFNVFSAVMQ